MLTSPNHLRILTVAWLASVVAVGFVSACGEADSTVAPSTPVSATRARAGHEHGAQGLASTAGSAKVERQLAQLRAITAPFHRFEAAAKAGWGTRITDCFSDPELGGMGYHYGNVDLIDGTVDPLAPELLLYEPMKNGRLRFVAVEYIVPFDAWQGSEPPQLFGLSFGRNEAFGLWVLHVWHFRNNPNGIFADWNPDVTCAHAAP
ncbi:MAG TPA: hypothetical protein VMM18_15955 [Gemmatimonadaceae bacterium]|nr:hypothetical protein [Gemmatimonadaceae bacterium]